MKLRDLKKTINEAINEVLTTQTDKTVVNISSQDPQKDMKIQQAKRDKKSYQLYEDEEINEMARIPVKYQVKDKEALKDIKNKWAPKIVDYLEQNGPSSTIEIANGLGRARQQMINPIIIALTQAGVVGPSNESSETFQNKQSTYYGTDTDISTDTDTWKSNKKLANFDDAEDLFVGGGFGDDFETGTLGGEEETEIEPSPSELEPETQPTKQNLSDEEAEKLMDYLDLKQRLEQVKGTIRSKKKASVSGDIRGKVTDKGEELEKARERKDNLERKIADLVASSPYLQKRVKSEDEINENTKKRLKKLANINENIN